MGATGSHDASPGRDARRRAVRRTVLALALVAVAVYAGFILLGVLGR